MSEKYEELARSARCMAGSTGTANWNAAKALFAATCTPYKIMEITEDFDRVTAERDAGLAREAALAQNLKYAEQGYLSIAESADASAQTLHEVISRLKAERDALQQRLTAADERAVVQASALARIHDRCEAFIEDERDMPIISVEVIRDIASRAALKPEEAAKCARCECSTVESCDERGCGFLGSGNGAP